MVLSAVHKVLCCISHCSSRSSCVGSISVLAPQRLALPTMRFPVCLLAGFVAVPQLLAPAAKHGGASCAAVPTRPLAPL
jgi:hypothetical protein